MRLLLESKKPTIARECRKTCSAMFQEAVYRELMERNPCEAVRHVRVRHYEPAVLDAQQANAYLSHFEGTDAEAIVLLALGGGFRRGEMAALRVEDIDWRTGAVEVDDSLVNTKQGVIRKETKTERRRIVHLPPSILARLKEVLPESGSALNLHPASISHVYERVRDSLPEGVPRIPLRDLRHTSLTLAYDATENLLSVQVRAGHSNPATTTRYYVRPKVDKDARTAAAMDELLRVPKSDNCVKTEPRDPAVDAMESHLREVKLLEVTSF